MNKENDHSNKAAFFLFNFLQNTMSCLKYFDKYNLIVIFYFFGLF